MFDSGFANVTMVLIFAGFYFFNVLGTFWNDILFLIIKSTGTFNLLSIDDNIWRKYPLYVGLVWTKALLFVTHFILLLAQGSRALKYINWMRQCPTNSCPEL